MKRFLAASLLSHTLWNQAYADKLPEPFVYLSDVDPSVIQDIRYSGTRNFTGAKVPGYLAGECILTASAAQALKEAQGRLRSVGLGLIVFDCYRPRRAVKSFVEWARNADEATKAVYYPKIPKTALLKAYIAGKSTHSRGSAVDLSLVRLGKVRRQGVAGTVPCYDPTYSEAFDGTLDMGTGFDCFDEKSHTASRMVSEGAQANRKLLVEAMAKSGFDNYYREWWHFQLRGESATKKSFDFPVGPKLAEPRRPTAEIGSERARPIGPLGSQ